MHLFVYYLLIILLPVLSARQDNSLIDWSAERKLTWEDFKAAPDNGYAAAALTSTNIKIDFGYANEAIKYHIHCRFDKNKSWGRVKNDYILAHEQAHFDVAEIYARKLNKALKDYKPNEATISKDVNKIYEGLMQKYYERQEEYDKETNFSINRTKQAEWITKISDELTELRDFANYH